MFGQQQQQPGTRGSGQVCSFYLKGQCKYGTQCWNLHPQNQGVGMGGMTGSTFGGGNVFGAKMTPQADSKEFNEFVKQVSGEMTQWERSGQWLFSSFMPLKSHPLLAGFSDLSPEELRIKAYDALKTNTSASYQEHWSKLQQQYKQLRDALKQPTPEAFQAMKDVFYAKSSSDQLQNPSQAGKSGGLFGKTSTSLFGGTSTQGTGLLGAKPQASIFGGSGGSLFAGSQPSSQSLFGDSAKKTLFGGPAAIGSQSASTFGNQSNPSPFGGGGNMFKSSTTGTLGGSSVFGGGAKIQGNSIFGGGAATTAATSSSGNIFGGNPSTSTGTIFGGGTTTPSTSGNVFGGAAASAPGIFGGSSTNPVASTSGNLFGNTSSTATTTPAGNIFGGATSTVFGNNNQGTTTFGGVGGTAATSSSVFGTSGTTLKGFGNPNPGGASGSVFGNTANLLTNPQNQNQQQQQTTTTLFGNPTSSAATSSIFGTTPATSDAQQQNVPQPFGVTTGPGTTFGGTGNTPSTVGTSGLFGNPSSTGMQSGSIFGNTNESKSNAGLFGKQPDSQQTSQSNVPSQPAQIQTLGGNQLPISVKAEWFTPMDKLDSADRGQFEAEAFTFVPLCPPPLELCF